MSSEVSLNTGPTQPPHPNTGNHPRQVRTFLQFLTKTLDAANTDCLKLAHKQWKLLNASNVVLPEIINTVFSSFDGSAEKLDVFIQKCETEAFRIKQVCQRYIKP